MMKKIAGLLIVISASTPSLPARSLAGEPIPQSPIEMTQWRVMAAEYNLNCPVARQLTNEGRNEKGAVWKLDCTVADGSKTWSLKIVRPPGGGASMEPWE